MAFDSNNIKKKSTLKKYRTGFNLAWSIPRCNEVLAKAGFKAPGHYYADNQQGGLMFALPREIPPACKFGEEEAGFVMRNALKAHVTRSQGEGIKKMLSFVHQLRTGDDGGNFKRVNQVWKKWPDHKFGAPTQTVKPLHVIEPESLKTAMTREWTHATPMLYEHWCVGYNVVHHWSLNGSRSKEDLNCRIKPGYTEIFPDQGYMFTQFLGGRAKLGPGAPERPWRAYAICLCKDGKHSGPPTDYYEYIIDKRPLPWCTSCPLSCYEIIRYNLGKSDPRIFPALTTSGFVAFKGKAYKSIGAVKMFPFARRWLDIQGGNPDHVEYGSNMGRKALGKLCDLLNISYPESFEITGDLWINWRYYQDAPVNDLNFRRRTQSKKLEVVTKALHKIARFFGRGRTVRADPDTITNTQLGQLMALQLRVGGHGAEVNRILDS